jgi:hypothetical protein
MRSAAWTRSWIICGRSLMTGPAAPTMPDLPVNIRSCRPPGSGLTDTPAQCVQMVGVEAVPGTDPRGAEELNDYAEQVEDVQEQLQERRRWMSDIVHDAANALTQRQGEQINRLTLVSLIFLPVTAVTGFFGMNFNWMISALDGKAAFFTLGMLLPISMVLLTVAWFIQRRFIQIGRRRPAPPPGNGARQRDD